MPLQRTARKCIDAGRLDIPALSRCFARPCTKVYEVASIYCAHVTRKLRSHIHRRPSPTVRMVPDHLAQPPAHGSRRGQTDGHGSTSPGWRWFGDLRHFPVSKVSETCDARSVYPQTNAGRDGQRAALVAAAGVVAIAARAGVRGGHRRPRRQPPVRGGPGRELSHQRDSHRPEVYAQGQLADEASFPQSRDAARPPGKFVHVHHAPWRRTRSTSATASRTPRVVRSTRRHCRCTSAPPSRRTSR